MIKVDFTESSVILRFSVDRFDMTNARAIRREIESHLVDRPALVKLDMSPLAAIDSSAIGTLKLLLDEIAAYGGQLILLNINKPALMMLKLSNLDTFFQFEDSHDV